jgi:hypothetical protein
VATPSANALLPMAGRAATTIICPGISFIRLSRGPSRPAGCRWRGLQSPV